MRIAVFAASIFVFCDFARAQNVTVQQPVVGRFGVSTTVVVPDRGRIYLGGLKRSLMGRNEAGVPGLGGLPVAGRMFRNRGIGRVSEATSTTAGVFIHDFQAMDDYLLGKAGTRLSASKTPASRAYAQMQIPARKPQVLGKPRFSSSKASSVKSPRMAEFYRSQAAKAARRGHAELARQFLAQAKQFE